MIARSIINFLKKPTVYYPILVVTIFSVLRLLNIFLEELIGYRILGPVTIGILVGYLFGREIERERKIYKLAITDPLSGLYNRAGFSSKISLFFSNLLEDAPISAITIDIDDFKEINDSYGHDAGDIAISTIGDIIKRNTRSTDVAARCGGDEFIVFLPQAKYEVARRVAESILDEVNETPIKTGSDDNITLYVSIGLASSNSLSTSKEKLFELSDKKMYESKSLGKNRICGIEVCE